MVITNYRHYVIHRVAPGSSSVRNGGDRLGRCAVALERQGAPRVLCLALQLVQRVEIASREHTEGRRREHLLAQDPRAIQQQLLSLGVVPETGERGAFGALGDRGFPVRCG